MAGNDLGPRRLLHVVNSLDLGGAERNLVELVKFTDRTHFEIHVLCLYSLGPLSHELRTSGVKVTSLNLSVELRLGHWWRVFRFIRRVRPEIVHAHLPEARWLSLPAAWLAGVPTRIAHVQNTHWQWPRKLRLLDRFAVSHATSAIACSHAVRRYCTELGRYPADKMNVVYNGADVDRFSNVGAASTIRSQLGLSVGDPVLICVASLTPQKGHRDLIEAFALVHLDCPEATLLLIGGGESSYIEGIRDLAEERGLKSAVRFLGQRTDVPDLLAASTLFVMASVWEGLGVAVVEAAFAGLPAVTTAVDGLVELVVDGESGYLVPPRQPAAFAQATLLLLRSPEERGRMGDAARERATKKFDSKLLALRVQDLYRA